MVSWNSDEHDGNSCPICGQKWVRPLPKPERWLVQALEENALANERRARNTNIFFALVYLLFFLLVIGWLGAC